MRTTLDLPDELFRQVKAKAALEGAKLKELLRRYVENGLRQPLQPSSSDSSKRSKLPIIKRRGKRRVPNLTARRQAELQEEEDLAKVMTRRGGRTVYTGPLPPRWDSGEAVSRMRDRRLPK